MDINDVLPLINRPLTAIEVAQLIGRDSIQTMAILDFLCAQGKLEKTKRKVGISPIYYKPEQREQALERLFSYLNEREKELVNKIKNANSIPITELKIEERLMLQDLTDFIRIEKRSEQGQEVEFATYIVPKQESQTASISKLIQPQAMSQTLLPAQSTMEIKEENKKIESGEEEKAKRRTRKEKTNITPEEVAKLDIKIERPLENGIYIAKYGKANIPILFTVENNITFKKLKELNELANAMHLFFIIFSDQGKVDIYDRCYIVNPRKYEQNR
jgi:hypothetical protein